MTPEAQRIAIAEACGWKDINRCTRQLKPREDGVELRGTKNNLTLSEREYFFLPSYLTDLNAMHEAEEHIHFNAIDQYVEEVGKIVRKYWKDIGKEVKEFNQQSVIMAHMHATAAQRAEAFLRALSLWTE